MKATINGITLEGTPQEIIEYIKLQEEKAINEQFDIYKRPACEWPKESITSGIIRDSSTTVARLGRP